MGRAKLILPAALLVSVAACSDGGSEVIGPPTTESLRIRPMGQDSFMAAPGHRARRTAGSAGAK